MSWKGDLFMGMRNFRSYHQGRLGFRGLTGAVLGIAFSMLPILVVLEVSSGMIEGITRRYVEVSSFHLQAAAYPEHPEEDLDAILKKLRALPGVNLVTPVIQGQGLIYSAEGRMGVQLRGMDPNIYLKDPEFKKYLQILSGEFSFGGDGRGLLLSRGIAEQLGVTTGDSIKLLVSRTSPRTGRAILRPGNYYVSGIFTTGYHELDMFTSFMSFSRAEEVFGTRGTLALGLKTGDYTRYLGGLKKAVESVLPETWYVTTWYEQERSLYQNLQTTKTMLLFIMGIIILVAAVNISSSLLNLVMEKQEQIAVIKSLGASPENIRRQFLFTGLLIGFLGVLLGTVLGLALSININQVILMLEKGINLVFRVGEWLINPHEAVQSGSVSLLSPEYYLEEIPIRIPLLETGIVGGFTILTCLLASYFPARRASRIKPLEIIRHH